MSRAPQDSLRSHRQTFQPNPRGAQPNKNLQIPTHGSFLTPDSLNAVSVQQKDKDKVSFN